MRSDLSLEITDCVLDLCSFAISSLQIYSKLFKLVVYLRQRRVFHGMVYSNYPPFSGVPVRSTSTVFC